MPSFGGMPIRSSLLVTVVSMLAENRAKIHQITFDALRTREPLVKGERFVRHEMRAVLFKMWRGIHTKHIMRVHAMRIRFFGKSKIKYIKRTIAV